MHCADRFLRAWDIDGATPDPKRLLTWHGKAPKQGSWFFRRRDRRRKRRPSWLCQRARADWLRPMEARCHRRVWSLDGERRSIAQLGRNRLNRWFSLGSHHQSLIHQETSFRFPDWLGYPKYTHFLNSGREISSPASFFAFLPTSRLAKKCEQEYTIAACSPFGPRARTAGRFDNVRLLSASPWNPHRRSRRPSASPRSAACNAQRSAQCNMPFHTLCNLNCNISTIFHNVCEGVVRMPEMVAMEGDKCRPQSAGRGRMWKNVENPCRRSTWQRPRQNRELGGVLLYGHPPVG